MISELVGKPRPTNVEEWADESWVQFTYALHDGADIDKAAGVEPGIQGLIAATVANAITLREAKVSTRQCKRILERVGAKAAKLIKAEENRYYNNPPMASAAVFLLANVELGIIKRSMMEQVLDYLEPVVAQKAKEMGF